MITIIQARQAKDDFIAQLESKGISSVIAGLQGNQTEGFSVVINSQEKTTVGEYLSALRLAGEIEFRTKVPFYLRNAGRFQLQ